MKAIGVALKPSKGLGAIETLGKMGLGASTITKVDGVARAVLRESGRSTDLRSFPSTLIAL